MYLIASGLIGCSAASRGHAPLGAARDGAGEMQPGRRLAAAGQDEGIERLKLGVHGVDLVLQPLDLRRHDAQRLLAALALAFGRAEIGAEIEQVVLDAGQHGVGFGERSPLSIVRAMALRARPITELASSIVP